MTKIISLGILLSKLVLTCERVTFVLTCVRVTLVLTDVRVTLVLTGVRVTLVLTCERVTFVLTCVRVTLVLTGVCACNPRVTLVLTGVRVTLVLTGVCACYPRVDLCACYPRVDRCVCVFRYGGEQARRAATTIQRAYRHYAMTKKFRAITATAKAQERRLSRRFAMETNAAPTDVTATNGNVHYRDPEQFIRTEFDQLNRNLSASGQWLLYYK